MDDTTSILNTDNNVDELFIYIFESFFFGLWMITVPFYSFLMFILIVAQRKRIPELSTPFFKLCISSGIIDLTNLLNNYIFAVFPKWGWGTNFYLSLGNFFPYFYLYTAWSMGICQAMSVSVLASNRLYAMIYPELYQKVWMGRKMLLSYFLQFAIGLLIALAVFVSDVEVLVTDIGLIPKFTLKQRSNLFFTIGGVFLGSNSLYLISAYCYLFFILRKQHKIQIGRRAQNLEKVQLIAKRRETRLFFMSSCIVSVQLVIVLFFVTKVFPIVKVTTTQFYVMYNALSDIYSCVNPYLLWIFSDALRKFVFKYLNKSKTVLAVTTIVV